MLRLLIYANNLKKTSHRESCLRFIELNYENSVVHWRRVPRPILTSKTEVYLLKLPKLARVVAETLLALDTFSYLAS